MGAADERADVPVRDRGRRRRVDRRSRGCSRCRSIREHGVAGSRSRSRSAPVTARDRGRGGRRATGTSRTTRSAALPPGSGSSSPGARSSTSFTGAHRPAEAVPAARRRDRPSGLAGAATRGSGAARRGGPANRWRSRLRAAASRSASRQRVVERRESLGADDPAEEQVGERGVAGQHRTVQVRADEPLGEHAVDPVRRRCRRRPRPGRAGATPGPSVVRPPWFSKPVSVGRPGVGSGSTTTSPMSRRRSGGRRQVDQPEAVELLAVARPRSWCRSAGSPAHTANTTAPAARARGRSRRATRASRPRPSPAGRPRRRRTGRRRASRGSACPAATSTSSASIPRRRHRSTSTTALPRSP